MICALGLLSKKRRNHRSFVFYGADSLFENNAWLINQALGARGRYPYAPIFVIVIFGNVPMLPRINKAWLYIPHLIPLQLVQRSCLAALSAQLACWGQKEGHPSLTMSRAAISLI
jgi:hypothetical protein